MSEKSPPVQSVPTNIVTGFLGVGKTSAILNLLKNKAKQERWAVLVNEFGEVGVDGSLVSGQQSETDEVFIREVPGGCMCCTSGLPMQIALNQLIQKARPHRLLIEPTGLGHPKEIVQVLQSAQYKNVLELNACITLVDARKLSDERYLTHSTFRQQIELADVVVGNKADTYGEEERQQLKNYVAMLSGDETPVLFTSYGAFDPALLSQKTRHAPQQANTDLHHHHALDSSEQSIPESGYLKVKNKGEGFTSLGWRFAERFQFNRNKVFTWLSGLEAERIKAVFITTEGVFGYNFADGTLTEYELDDCLETRIEIISQSIDEQWELDILELAGISA